MKITGVHPMAEVFPMMTDDELNDLSADIKEHGQLHPIIADDSGILIDGRNRWEACKRADVEPWIEALNGHDPTALIVSANLARRNLTKGQKAMALALIYPEPEHGGSRKKGSSKVSELGFSKQRLSQARSVLAYSRDLAMAVISGQEPLDAALVKVQQEQKRLQSDEVLHARLSVEAPDLSDLVTEERMKLPEAIAALNERKELQIREQRRATELLRQIIDLLFPHGAEPNDWGQRLVADVNAEFWPPNAAAPLTEENLQLCVDVLRGIKSSLFTEK